MKKIVSLLLALMFTISVFATSVKVGKYTTIGKKGFFTSDGAMLYIQQLMDDVTHAGEILEYDIIFDSEINAYIVFYIYKTE